MSQCVLKRLSHVQVYTPKSLSMLFYGKSFLNKTLVKIPNIQDGFNYFALVYMLYSRIFTFTSLSLCFANLAFQFEHSVVG